MGKQLSKRTYSTRSRDKANRFAARGQPPITAISRSDFLPRRLPYALIRISPASNPPDRWRVAKKVSGHLRNRRRVSR